MEWVKRLQIIYLVRVCRINKDLTQLNNNNKNKKQRCKLKWFKDLKK